MELTHQFSVPTPVEETWAVFQDIASVAECFPGAQVTSAEGDSFTGTCKVKLGPIALVYQGSGTFVERDEGAHRFVVEAKGKDKRGNGTAGATVTLTMTGSADGTDVVVVTDLAITGKPAQFGRGVMQDVSDKLLGQFVVCLEQRLSGGDTGPDTGQDTGQDTDQDAGPASAAVGAAAAPSGSGDQDAGPASSPTPAAAARAPATSSGAAAAGAADQGVDDALDLGAAVLPVLLRTYGKQVAAAVLTLLGVAVVVRVLRRP
ncbi:SRPBCC family protein [Nocardioides sp. TF02-7]|uniref:SRPBCC family protein n=1 Tax=Nocardioides sp. TF02-7 TaxID=2917724 RepID=UPI001F053E33|nr:SRPBCC family protein [Nocardioides sp. TF02-7]UMG93451.1 SRPBCC family protein [Nocardioides sp. TF02-7]